MTQLVTRVMLAAFVTASSWAADGPPLLPPRQTEGGILFEIWSPGPERVSLAGSFNGWAQGSHVLEDPDGDGVRSIVVPLPPGRHEYLLLLDGQLPVRGGRLERSHLREFQSHQPLEMDVHWLVPVFVVSVGDDGRLVASPRDPTLSRLLDAARLHFDDGRGLYPAYRDRALALNRGALELTPGSTWLLLQRQGIESGFRLQAMTRELRRRASESDLETVASELLGAAELSTREVQRALELVRALRREPGSRERGQELARMALRAGSRQRVPEAIARWRAARGDLLARVELLETLKTAYRSTDPDRVLAWSRALLDPSRPDDEHHGARQLAHLGLELSTSTHAATAVPRIAAWLLRYRFPPELVGLGWNPLPRDGEQSAAIETLELLEADEGLANDYLYWALNFSPRLRNAPEAAAGIRRALAGTRDALAASRLAARLAYIHLLSHDEAAYYGLLRERLAVDPTDRELLGNFAAFQQTLEGLEREFPGLLVNPWRAGILEALEGLRGVAPANPELLMLLARALDRQGRRREGEALLEGLLSRDPGDARAARLLAGWLEASGLTSEARSILEACWRVRPCPAEIAQPLARLRVLEEGPGVLESLPDTPVHREESYDALIRGAVEGLLATTTADDAARRVDGLSPGRGQSIQARAWARLAAASALEDAAFEAAVLQRAARSRSAAQPERSEAVGRAAMPDLVREGGLHSEPGSLVSSSPELHAAELLHYASHAAASAGRIGPASRLAREALALAPGRRAWLIEALRSDDEALRALACELGLRTQTNPAPFLRELARRGFRDGRWRDAIGPLIRLEALSPLPEDRRAVLAARALAEVRSADLPGAALTLRRLARSDRPGGILVLAVLLCPLLFAGALSCNGWPWISTDSA